MRSRDRTSLHWAFAVLRPSLLDIFGQPERGNVATSGRCSLLNVGSVSVNYTTGGWYHFESERAGGIKELIRVYKEIGRPRRRDRLCRGMPAEFRKRGKAAPNRGGGGQHHQQEIEAIYQYTDTSAETAFEVVRFVASRKSAEATLPSQAQENRPASDGHLGSQIGVGCGVSKSASSCAQAQERIGFAPHRQVRAVSRQQRAEDFQ